jgi:hypothetical protein
MYDLAIIGGGAAGFFTAINVKRKHPTWKLAIFEKSQTFLGKVAISGGGRCNVTHACFDPQALCQYYPRGKKELRSVFERFGPKETIAWFKHYGIAIKQESDGRMFPESNTSETIVDCFLDACDELDIELYKGMALQSIEAGTSYTLQFQNAKVKAKNVAITSGSSQSIWQMLQTLGHTIVAPVPSLFTFNIKDPFVEDLMGVSVPKAQVKLDLPAVLLKSSGLKAVDITQSGPLLVTHWGLSGPAILKLSAVAARALHDCQYQFKIKVNLCGLNQEDCLAVLLNIKSEQSKKLMVNTPFFEIPNRWWQRIVQLCIDNTQMTWADCNKKTLQSLAQKLSDYSLEVKGKSTFKDEFVTAGGVDLKDIQFKTMESKLLPRMYFAGEVINVDALTGGFNFQAAWSESWIIAQSI